MSKVEQYITSIPDFPKEGIIFRDITTVLGDADGFHLAVDEMTALLDGVEFDDIISGVEVKHGCLDRHLLITAIGAHIIRLIPPLIVTEEDCDKAVAIIEETVKALEK